MTRTPSAPSIGEIAALLGARAEGDTSMRIARPCEPADAGPEDLALAMNPKYADGLAKGRARAAILWQGADWQELGLRAAIFVERPRAAMSGLTRAFDAGPDIAPGRHATAVIDATARIGEGAAIGPFVVIGAGVVVGPRARIAARVTIERGAEIGADALLLAGVHIGHGVRIGDRFVAQPGAVIGSDGFSFVTPEKSTVERARETLGSSAPATAQSWLRIHSLGGVEIADDVEIGANTCIDRGTIRATRIGRGCKFDNLVHVAHNVEIGEDCLFAGQVGIAGSTRIGNRVVFGGQVGVSDNLFVGDDVVAGGASVILSNVPGGRAVLGYPANRMDAQIDTFKHIRRLGRLFDQVADLRKAVFKGKEAADDADG